MIYDFTTVPEQYELIGTEYVGELRSQAGILKHKKTGARVLVLSNEDDNKVFQIGFRTPPSDSTGVPHIMEHSVLSGSQKYPVKDPFVELLKGSVNTFLNAMTFPDKTVYPYASCNDKDFRNLMDIYLDAVFHPNIYKHDMTFRQEGWHYEIEDEDAPLKYNGVVYNEMKGAFSAPEEVLTRKIMDSLFPDTIYSVECGGDPDVIPELTYEDYLDFHRKYYHPSNSFIILYGNMDVEERLCFLDENYLADYDYLEVDSSIPVQQPFAAPVSSESSYPVGQDESTDSASYLAMNWVVGQGSDPVLSQAFNILEYVLLETPGAPVKQALLDAECGEDIYGSFEIELQQPYFSLVIKNMDPARKDEIVGIVKNTIADLVKNGINRRSLEGTINSMEFKAREADFGRFPKGLMYSLQIMDSWLYDEERPLLFVKYDAIFSELRSKLDSGYFEELLRTYILDNSHASVVMLNPEQGLAAKKEQELADKLAAYKASLSKEEIRSLVDACKALKEYQDTPNTEEELRCIPMLSIDDIKKEAEPLVNAESDYKGMHVLHHDIDTSNITYVTLLFDVHHIPAEEVPYLGILAEALAEMDTDKYSYSEITDEINLWTGGITASVSSGSYGDGGSYRANFILSGKVLSMNLPKLRDLMSEILTHTDFSDDRRLRDILNQLKSRCEMNLMSAGHAASMTRAVACFSQSAWFKELSDGIEFYRFVADILKDYDNKKEELIHMLQHLVRKIFRKEYLLADFTCTQEDLGTAQAAFSVLADSLFADEMTEQERGEKNVGFNPVKREAFTTPGMVQYNAIAGNFKSAGIRYDGAMAVLRNILGTDFLWNEIRVKGGAYGVMCGFPTSGDAFFTSYRDPHLASTFAVYEAVAEYLDQLDLDEREVTQYTIGAFGAADLPLTASGKGSRSLAAWLYGKTYEELQQIRDEMRATSNEKLRGMAEMVRAVNAQGYVCVIGSESKVMEEKDRFDSVRPLLA